MLLTTCSYVPLEIPLSCGIPARRFFLKEGAGPCVDSFLPRDMCPYARGTLESLPSAAAEGGPVLLALAGSCDAMRRAADVARFYAQRFQVRVYFIDVPRSCDEDAVEYYAGVLEEFRKAICPEKSGAEPLRQAIETMNAFRSAVLRLFEEARGSAAQGSWSRAVESFLGVMDSINPEGFAEVHLTGREARALSSEGSVPRVAVTGTMCLDATVVSAVEEAGLRITCIDSCFGDRSVDFQVEASAPDLFRALARAYLRKTSCPRMLHRAMQEERYRRVLGTPGDAPDGVVYFVPKFCDQGYYDYVEVKRRAVRAGLPVLLLEGEPGAGKSLQVRTRLLAFREMLEMRRSRTSVLASSREGRGWTSQCRGNFGKQ